MVLNLNKMKIHRHLLPLKTVLSVTYKAYICGPATEQNRGKYQRQNSRNVGCFLLNRTALLYALILIFSGCKPIGEDSLPVIQTFTLTFRTQGGSEVPRQTIKKGEKANKPADPTKKDSIFQDWYTDSNVKDIFDFNNTTIIADTIVYAKWNAQYISATEAIEDIKTTKKVDLFHINTPLYDRKGTQIKDKTATLAFSKIFPTPDRVLELYKTESGFNDLFENNILFGAALVNHGFNVNKKRGDPYFLFVIDNKIYLDDDHYIRLTFDREETYMKEMDGSVWEIPTGISRLTWDLEMNTSQPNQLNGYAGYIFSNFPRGSTNTDSSIKLRCQVFGGDYVAGNNYTLQLTLKQKLVFPSGEIQLENYVIQKTFTTVGGSGTSSFRKYDPDVFFQADNTHFPY
ncbi:InlB B-repeat-containing protein [Candidatus Haliotispira prima]|uniref:InlB B-repeat-containing protein n=1 Tax=Candidatus Haliotispira prima TaxID=3034016 RepID=A0ABY8MGJ5_9SPIO|nr:InlB B-repeat-containing protein [Candidatus Haliotispira prima]